MHISLLEETWDVREATQRWERILEELNDGAKELRKTSRPPLPSILPTADPIAMNDNGNPVDTATQAPAAAASQLPSLFEAIGGAEDFSADMLMLAGGLMRAEAPQNAVFQLPSFETIGGAKDFSADMLMLAGGLTDAAAPQNAMPQLPSFGTIGGAEDFSVDTLMLAGGLMGAEAPKNAMHQLADPAPPASSTATAPLPPPLPPLRPGFPTAAITGPAKEPPSHSAPRNPSPLPLNSALRKSINSRMPQKAEPPSPTIPTPSYPVPPHANRRGRPSTPGPSPFGRTRERNNLTDEESSSLSSAAPSDSEENEDAPADRPRVSKQHSVAVSDGSSNDEPEAGPSTRVTWNTRRKLPKQTQALQRSGTYLL